MLHKFKVRPLTNQKNSAHSWSAIRLFYLVILLAGNIMHSFHDDWLPLLFTIAGTEEFLKRNNGAKDYYYHWVTSELIWRHVQMVRESFSTSTSLLTAWNWKTLTIWLHLCFADGWLDWARVLNGINMEWGNMKAQFQLWIKIRRWKNIKEAIRWIKNGLNIPDDTETKNKSITVITRKSNRLILEREWIKESLKPSPEYENVQF